MLLVDIIRLVSFCLIPPNELTEYNLKGHTDRAGCRRLHVAC